jgi:hypothetical protein
MKGSINFQIPMSINFQIPMSINFQIPMSINDPTYTDLHRSQIRRFGRESPSATVVVGSSPKWSQSRFPSASSGTNQNLKFRI